MEMIVTLLIPVTFVAALVLERVVPARPLPKVKRWLGKGFAFFVFSGLVNALLPGVVVAATGRYAPLDLSVLGTVGGAIAAFVLGDVLSYGVHRLQHNVHFVWRWTHQMHHSAERLDIAGAVYFHPFDFVQTIALTTFSTTMLGVTPNAAILAGFIGFLYAMFQHLNVRTPTWIGYIVQRPEAHSVHHGRGIHAYNYANFPLWDILFGTFRNPADFEEKAGFWDGASAKMGAMLLGRDVGEPLAQEPSQSSSVGMTMGTQSA